MCCFREQPMGFSVLDSWLRGRGTGSGTPRFPRASWTGRSRGTPTDRDEMVSNTINTFCSVTIQCCQCHNHKFDPFTQEHYYKLQSIFAAVDKAERPYDLDPEVEQRRLKLTAELEAARAAQAASRPPSRKTAGERSWPPSKPASVSCSPRPLPLPSALSSATTAQIAPHSPILRSGSRSSSGLLRGRDLEGRSASVPR